MDGAYVSIEDALPAAVRVFTRVGYLEEHVTTFIDRRPGRKLVNVWLVIIAADGFPLRAGVGTFQLALVVGYIEYEA